MATGRGTLLLNSAAFVRTRFGEEGQRRVLAAIPDVARHFSGSGSLPEGARIPLEHLILYMTTARSLLAPEAADFYREMGRFSAAQESKGGLAHIVSDRETLVKMLRTLWRAYFDSGSFEVVEKDGNSFTGRVVDFEGHAALCERISGVADAHFRTAHVEHVACVFRGDARCDWKVRW